MTAGWTAYAPRAAGLRVLAGGDPGPEALAAIAAALTALTDEEAAPPADPTPVAYRSPWRRAAMQEAAGAAAGPDHSSRSWGAR
ncbi:hypothetical protein [Miltoncostaea marina]|uniref:hypothetical protein n=1 Tax=Miltoncostaea marina TaxID=2843215 RepID=UPI001C3CA269|nr:hypothetical protein [Miltoncostaea marina]